MMHGIDKSCMLEAQDKGGGLIHLNRSDRLLQEMPSTDMTFVTVA
jgi:hypothetical protein